MLTTLLTAAVFSAVPTAQDLIDGAEIGNADGYVAFESHGKYHAEKIDKAKGNTVLKGSWVLTDEVVDVKLTSCKGPACKELNKPYKATVIAAAERALLVKAPADSLFPSGSYYCHYLGCEKRIGVELVSKGAKASSVGYVLDTLIDKNKGRNTTIVWWSGKKATEDVKATRLEYCTREEARAKKGAEEAAADLSGLAWVGKLEPVASAEKDCLWDVRLVLADGLMPPARVR